MSKSALTAPATDAEIREYVRGLGLDGVIDMHVHFMPDSVQQKVWTVFDRLPEMGEPAWPIHYRTDDDARLQTLRDMGISRFPTLNYAHRPNMAAWLNEYSAQMAAKNPDVIHSATFFPEDSAAEYTAEVLAAGAEIFKVHVQVGEFSPLDPQLAEVWAQIESARTPVVIHCGTGPHGGQFTGPDPIFDLVERYPELVLIIAHMGMPEYQDFARLAEEAPGVYLDTTMVGTDYMNQLQPLPENFIDTAGTLGHKIVLGTDFPTIPYPYSHQIQALHNWGLGDDWMRAVLWENASWLLARDQAVTN